MNRFVGFVVGLLVLAGIAVIAWYHYGPPSEAPVAAPVAAAAAPAESNPPSEPEYRVPDEAATGDAGTAPMPALADSDSAVWGEMEDLAGKEPVEALLIPTQIIRRWVAFVDSLDRDGLPVAQRPVKRVPGWPQVKDDNEDLVLDDANARRYDDYLAVVKAVNAKRFVAFYFRYYPLFQRAYEELGYGGRYFNTRLLHVIDDLLAAPIVSGPIKLVRPNVMYKFADPELESLSFGQKTLIRLGPDGEQLVKDKLRAIRTEIVARAKQPGSPKEGTP
ncbi:DUF3014 domain-containing protein [Solimonas terrae]|uniref:DUF3014 domain-containing protein n=1 Tax=Solimonas terrae TaxID=1396819 RepID=A0A6M2BSS6_9GAMM|nr:DUF3014 domain-containing protein [Solimonas terrae]NGY05173.1 DUF3014 domain-containing protein [Solimonas terrae]